MAGKMVRGVRGSGRRSALQDAVLAAAEAEGSRIKAALAVENADRFSGSVREGWLRLAKLWDMLAQEQEQLIRLSRCHQLH